VKKLKTVAYYRNSISTEKQRISIEFQLDHTRELAAKNKIVIEDEYFERETSARKTKTEERPQMQRLLAEIRKGSIGRVIVYSRCRIARNVMQYMEIYHQFKDSNVEVIFSADFELPMFYSPEGEMIERILGAANQKDAENTVKKLNDSKKTRARQGKHAAGPINYGYKAHEDEKNHKGDWVVVDEEKETLIKLFDSFLCLEFKTKTEFIKKLNEKNICKADGSSWDYKDLNYLSNPIYKGVRTYRPKDEEAPIIRSVPGLKIISEEVWNEVQEKMAQFKRDPREIHPVEENTIFLLEELLRCRKCNHKVKGGFIKKQNQCFPIYRCIKNCKVKVDKNFLESEVIKYANRFFSDFLSPTLHQFLINWTKDNNLNFKKALQPLNQKRIALEKKITARTHELMKKGLLNNIPLQIKQEYLELEELNKQIERFELSGFNENEKLHLIQELNEMYKNDIDKVISECMDLELIRALLLDVTKEVLIDEYEAFLIFQHPYFEPLGGREVIELI
jgi:site-specific DNA recombinase